MAPTDDAWFTFLQERAGSEGRLDEVNFWSPSSTRPMVRLTPGDPVFFRLKAPRNRLVGYGFFAHFLVLRLEQAWRLFGEKNGDRDELGFLRRIGSYRRLDLTDPETPKTPLGCTILRDARFWPASRWLPWDASAGWSRNIVRGRTETDPVRVSRLLGEIQYDTLEPPAEFDGDFHPLDVDERQVRLAAAVQREGQGSFRARLLSAYGSRCAITGEHTEIVLDAAHIQPYLGPRSNHVQNGLLLAKEFHTLFDAGYVTITPEREVRISPRLRHDWDNGRRYYPFDARPLAVLPSRTSEQPSAEALEWHATKRFRG